MEIERGVKWAVCCMVVHGRCFLWVGRDVVGLNAGYSHLGWKRVGADGEGGLE